MFAVTKIIMKIIFQLPCPDHVVNGIKINWLCDCRAFFLWFVTNFLLTVSISIKLLLCLPTCIVAIIIHGVVWSFKNNYAHPACPHLLFFFCILLKKIGRSFPLFHMRQIIVIFTSQTLRLCTSLFLSRSLCVHIYINRDGIIVLIGFSHFWWNKIWKPELHSQSFEFCTRFV